MSTKELRLEGPITTIRINDVYDKDGHIVMSVHTNGAAMNSMGATLDRNQQHLLMLYLQERLGSRDDGQPPR